MSYFGRLVEQSHLTVASPSADARAVTPDVAPTADGIDAGASGPMAADAVDLVEINEIVEASTTPVPTAPRDAAASVPPHVTASDAVVLAPMTNVRDVPSGRTELESAKVRIESEVVAAPAETVSSGDVPSAVEGSTYEIAMRRVLEWVAAGPKPGTPQAGVIPGTTGVEERIVEHDAPARTLDHSSDDEPRLVESVVAPSREIPMRAIALAPRMEAAAREIVMDSRAATAAERASATDVAPVIEDVVQVSIGTISVRIEAPAAPAPTAVAPPPRTTAPPPQAPRESERSTRLARRYLHP